MNDCFPNLDGAVTIVSLVVLYTYCQTAVFAYGRRRSADHSIGANCYPFRSRILAERIRLFSARDVGCQREIADGLAFVISVYLDTGRNGYLQRIAFRLGNGESRRLNSRNRLEGVFIVAYASNSPFLSVDFDSELSVVGKGLFVSIITS